jgi:hypothetical protein
MTYFRVCSDIRAGVLDISDNYFLNCLYPKAQGDPDDVEKNFLRSGLLVKIYPISTFCLFFTNIFVNILGLSVILCTLHIPNIL